MPGRARVGAAAVLAAASAACFLPRMQPLPGPEAGGPEAGGPEAVPAYSIEEREAARRDSLAEEAVRIAILAARRDSILAARREAERQDSLRALARQDSMRAAAVRDSIAAVREAELEAARRDSMAAAERRETARLEAERREAARRDSIAAAEQAAREAAREAARRDSVEAARRDSIEAARLASDPEAQLEALRASGPAYAEYDEGPRLVRSPELDEMLARTLLPVIRSEGLDASTAASLWILVRATGRVDRAMLRTTSTNAAFDGAAARAARGFLFAPAVRDGRAVPMWVVRSVSLTMR